MDATTTEKPAVSTNIKGLPEGRTYFTQYGATQAYPWVELKRTAKTVTLQKVNVQKDPDWTPEMHVGGFAAHCSNQSEQTWLYAGINESYQRTIRLTKKGWIGDGDTFRENVAREFYDYNF